MAGEHAASLTFEFHRIVDLQGATSPEAADLDGDGDLDVLLVTVEQRLGRSRRRRACCGSRTTATMRFTMHGIATSPTHLQTVAIGDLDGDGRPDAVTGGMHISRPYDRLGRVTAWLTNRGPPMIAPCADRAGWRRVPSWRRCWS